MSTFLAAVALIAATQVGIIQVFVDPGVDVFLDSQPMGRSAGRGLEIRDVAPGEHIITVRTSWGTSIGMKVNVAAGQITSVPVASLGLRGRSRGDDSTVVVRVAAKTPTCDLAIGGQSVSGPPGDLQIDRVASGPYRVALKCGAKSASMDVTLAPGRILTLQADLATSRMKMLTDDPRITEMRVRTAADVIMAMSLPIGWRHAFVSALAPNVKLVSIQKINDRIAEAVFVSPNSSVAYDIAALLTGHDETAEVNITRWRYLKEGTGDVVEATYRVAFR